VKSAERNKAAYEGTTCTHNLVQAWPCSRLLETEAIRPGSHICITIWKQALRFTALHQWRVSSSCSMRTVQAQPACGHHLPIVRAGRPRALVVRNNAASSSSELPGPRNAFVAGQEADTRRQLFNRISPVYDRVSPCYGAQVAISSGVQSGGVWAHVYMTLCCLFLHHAQQQQPQSGHLPICQILVYLTASASSAHQRDLQSTPNTPPDHVCCLPAFLSCPHNHDCACSSTTSSAWGSTWCGKTLQSSGLAPSLGTGRWMFAAAVATWP
jgi:hypothetical protein